MGHEKYNSKGEYALLAQGQKYLADHEKVVWAAACSQFSQVMNGAGMCMFGGFIGVNRIPIFEWLNAATGWDKSPEEYMRIGWNIQTLRQAFNAHEGIPLRHAINPRAVGVPPQTEGREQRTFTAPGRTGASLLG